MKKFKLKIGLVGIVFALVFPVFAFGVGDNVNFNVDSAYDREARFEHKGVLIEESKHGYFYLDRQYWKVLSTQEDWEIEKSINALAEEFDRNIYPKLTSFWGSEWRPGIDDDKKITVLISKLNSNVGGYFNPRDQFSRDRKEDSNEREMIYLNTKYLQHPRLKSFLAHEFQHLISFNQKNRLREFRDDNWLNDVRSEYSPTLLGYDKNFATSNLRYRISSFQNNPYVSLTKWNNSNLDYGVVSLFGHYVENIYGQDVLKRTSFQSVPGIKSLEASLEKEGYDEIDFEKVFSDWILASLLNDPSLKEQKYTYLDPSYLQDVDINPVETVIFGSKADEVNFTDRVQEWAWRNYEFKKGNDFEADTIELSLKNKTDSKRGALKAKVVTRTKQGLEEIKDLNIEEGQARMNILMGEAVDKVNLVVFNKYRGEYPSGDLGKETEIQLEVSAAPSESNFELSRIEPDTFLNRSGRMSLKGLNLSSVEKVEIGEQVIDEFEKQTEQELVFQFEKFENSGPKDLRLKSQGFGLQRDDAIRAYKPVKEGKLIRGKRRSKLYVVKNGFKRHISAPQIIDMYPHLSLGEIQILEPEEMNFYQESNLVRPEGEERVYQVDEKGKKHWLDLTAKEFEQSERSWEEVYLISKKEAQFYSEGEPIRN